MSHKRYVEELKEEFGYLATWVPNSNTFLGDVGVVNNYKFEKETTLKSLGIEFSVRSPGASADYEYVSKGDVEIVMKAKGELPPEASRLSTAQAGVSMRFASTDAVVFQALRCKESSIEDRAKVGREIRSCKGWQSDYVVITDLIESESTTIVISNGSKGTLELGTDLDLKPAQFKIASLEAQFSVVGEKSIGTKIIAQGGLTPLFKAWWLRPKFFGGKKFEHMGSGSDAVFEEFKFDEYNNVKKKR